MTTPINPLPKIEPPRDLVALNERIGELEQNYANPKTTEAARKEISGFFETHLSDNLIFRRASGKVVGKSGPESFLEGLGKNPFSSRRSEETAVTVFDDRALITLIVI